MKLPRYPIAALMTMVVASALAFAAARLWPRPDEGVNDALVSVSHRLVGVVKRLDRDEGEIVIRHEAIPGYMAAMTMPFRVRDEKELVGIEPGDAVEGTLEVLKDDASLSGLKVTRRAPKPPEGLGGPKLDPPTKVVESGEPVPDFAMTTQQGEPLKLSDLRGEAVVLTFVFTRCPIPTACPLMDRKFAELADRVGSLPGWADRVRLLSVSFDPEHDTPEVLARHAKLKGAKPPLWRFAVATHRELNKVAPALGVGYGPDADGGLVHTLSTAVVAPDGRLAWLDRTSRWAPADVVKALKPLVAR